MLREGSSDMAKKKPKITFICVDCGFVPEGKKQGNWQVFDPKCPKCGGKIELNLSEGD